MLYHKAVVEHKSAQVEVRVQDQGPGISSEKLEHIFDRFYCEEDVIVPRFGLGLPIAKALVEGMGGIISMNSEIDEGSVMILLLPGEQRA